MGRLGKFDMPSKTLGSFYKGTVKSILTNSTTVLCLPVQELKTVERVMRASQSISGTALPMLKNIHQSRAIRRAYNITVDNVATPNIAYSHSCQ